MVNWQLKLLFVNLSSLRTLSLAAFRNSFVMALATFRKMGEITVLSVFTEATYKQIFSVHEMGQKEKHKLSHGTEQL
jgi:hypothetical protein